MAAPKLTISRIAQQAGVGVETIRYYQRIGIIEEPPKPATGYRVYPTETVSRLKFIGRAKELGFTLAEIADLLRLSSESCEQAQQLAEHKLGLIRAKLADLNAMATALEELVDSCRDNSSYSGCPIIDTLSKNSS